MQNWDDLKYLLATVRCGSFSLAAQELDVNRTTVARRVSALQQQLGTPLLEHSTAGFQLTPVGEEVVANARVLERHINELEQTLSGNSQTVAGSLRVAVPLGLGPEFMAELGRFCDDYPNIEMELLNTVDPIASVNQRKADVGIGLAYDLPDYLAGHSAGDLQRAIYASQHYLQHYSPSLPVSDHRWVGWGREMSHTQVAKWMQRHVSSNADIRLRVNSWHALREAVRNGVGVGHLWCFLADNDNTLVRISENLADLTIGLWLFHHRDVHNNKRVDAFMAAMAPLLSARIVTD